MPRELLTDLIAPPGRPTAGGEGLPGGRRLALCGLFVLVFALTCSAIAKALELPGGRLPEGSLPHLKEVRFAEEKDAFDAVFLGSSRVYRQIDPALFDRTLAERGVPTHSFNYGVVGMEYHELRYTLERIAAWNPRRLRWVLIELRPPNPFVAEENVLTHRNIHWRDATTSLAAARDTWRAPVPLGAKLSALAAHVQGFAMRSFNCGTALPTLRRLLGIKRSNRELPEGGFLPLDLEARQSPSLQAQRERLVREPSRLEELRRVFLRSISTPPLDPGWARIVDELGARVRAAGAEPIFLLLPPSWEHQGGVLEARDESPFTLLDYHDLRLFPQYYDVEHLFNGGHLNAAGARLLTGRLANDFAALVAR